MAAPGFPFTLPHLMFLTHTLHHDTTPTLILDNFSYLQLHTILRCGPPKWSEIKNGSHFRLYPLYSGTQMSKWQEGSAL